MTTRKHQPSSVSLPLYSLLCFALLTTMGCSTRIQVTEYPTPFEDKLATLATYCWADSISKPGALEKLEPMGGHHKLFDKDVRETIDADLHIKGYQQADCATAGFVIDYRMGLHEDVAAVDASLDDSATNPYGPRWSIGDDTTVTYEGLTAPKEDIIIVRHGTLHIATFTATNKILWHSSAEKMLNDQDSDATREANLKMTVQKIMAGFPTRK